MQECRNASELHCAFLHSCVDKIAAARHSLRMRNAFIAVPILVLALTAPPHAAEPNWHLTATVAESCSCTISCPCNFGGEPNRNPCEGNRLIAIKSGHYESVDLGGVTFLVTFNMRNWSKIYVSDKIS